MKELYLSVIKFPMLVSLSLIILAAAYFGMALVNYHGLGLSALETIIYTLLFIILVVLVSSWMLILMSTHSRVKSKYLRQYCSWMLTNVYFYFAKWLGKITLHKNVAIQESFLNFNNEIVLSSFNNIHSSNIMLLLPHCLQGADCKIRITNDIIECAQCGACDISNLKEITQRYKLHSAVATGGSLARKLIKENNPEVVIAVACHRDLTDGVRDGWRYPIYAVLNERPNGPCHETRVNTKIIEFAIKKFA